MKLRIYKKMNVDLTKICRLCLGLVINKNTLHVFDIDFRDNLLRFESLIGTSLIQKPNLPTKICEHCVLDICEVLSKLEKWSRIQQDINNEQMWICGQKNKENLEAAHQISRVTSVNTMEMNDLESEPCSLLDTIHKDDEFTTLLSKMNTTPSEFVETLYGWSNELMDDSSEDFEINGEINNSSVPTTEAACNEQYASTVPLITNSSENVDLTKAPNPSDNPSSSSNASEDIKSMNESTSYYYWPNTTITSSNQIPSHILAITPSISVNSSYPSNFTKDIELKMPPLIGYNKKGENYNTTTRRSNQNPSYILTICPSTPTLSPSSEESQDIEFQVPPLIAFQKESTNNNDPHCSITNLNTIKSLDNPTLLRIAIPPLVPIVNNQEEMVQNANDTNTGLSSSSSSFLTGNDEDCTRIQKESTQDINSKSTKINLVHKSEYTPSKKSIISKPVKNPCHKQDNNFVKTCVFCKMVHHNAQKRSYHERSHKGEKISCDTCGKTFQTIRHLRNHLF